MATKLEEALDAFGVAAIAYGCDKATLDQTRALRAAVLAAHEEEVRELREALTAQATSRRPDGYCFCRAGDPEDVEHSNHCLKARAVLSRLGGNGG